MLKAKTKEHTSTQSNECKKERIKWMYRRRRGTQKSTAPTMVAAMKYLMLSGREEDKETKNAENECNPKHILDVKKYNRPSSGASLDAAT